MIFPENLEIPPPVRASHMNTGEWLPVRVFMARSCPAIEFLDGVKRVYSAKDILTCLRSKHSFTICPPGVFDSLLKWFPREQIFRLDLGCAAWLDGENQILYRGSSIRVGLNGRYKYLWNLRRFFVLDEEPTSLKSIEALVSLLIHHLVKNKIHFSDLASPSSVARHLLALYSYQEFMARTMDTQVLDDFYKCSHGGRQESTGIGTVNAWNYDMSRAHLGILSELPSLRGCQYRKDFPYTPEASYGAYLIRVNIPRMEMCPLPFELQNEVKIEVIHPHGEIEGWYSKPYLDLLVELGIPFKVMGSHQYIPIGVYHQPFLGITRLIKNFLTNAPHYINAKGLYYGIAGSTISWRYVIDEETGEFYPRAFGVFSPMIYSHVLAIQSTRVFKEATKGGAIAIRSDAVTTRNRFQTSLRLEDFGLMTFLTPMFKAFPSGRGDFWRGLIEMYRDKGFIEYEVTEYPTIRRYLNRGTRLGRSATSTISVRPNHGKRIGMIPTRVGDLLTNWIPSISPPVDHFR